MALTVTLTSIPELLIIEPGVLGDERGFFLKALMHLLFRMLLVLRSNLYKTTMQNQYTTS
jgi:dTDP-4-dehydrorhamnose 3,5-epimerase-like enzyme